MKIHQIYLNYDGYWDDVFEMSKQSWSNIPDTEYKLWSEDDLLNLLTEYPFVKSIWDRLKYPIQKVDLGRWVIIYHYGGLYADLDVVNKDPTLSYIDTDNFLTSWNKKIETDILYFNSPHHPYLKNLFTYLDKNLTDIHSKPIYNIWKGRYILQSCGPYAISRYFKLEKITPNLKEFHIENSPHGKQFWENLNSHPHIRRQIDNSPVIVYKTGSWNTPSNNLRLKIKK